MNGQLLDYLKQRHAYEAWRGCNALNENLFIWKFFLSGNEFPGWEPDRIQRIEGPTPLAPAESATGESPPPGGGIRLVQSVWERPEGQPEAVYRIQHIEVPAPPVSSEPMTKEGLPRRERSAVIRSFWKPLEGRPDALLNVNVFECPSRITAHEFLLRLLTEFQSPLIARRDDIAVGDVAFAGPGDAVVLFARANLVHLIRNAGRDITSVTDIASQLDRYLMSKPETVGVSAMAEIRRVEVAVRKFRVGEKIPLVVEATAEPTVRASAALVVEETAPLERPVCYKVFAPGASKVYQEEKSVVYQPISTGPQKVKVFAINVSGVATGQDLQLNIAE